MNGMARDEAQALKDIKGFAAANRIDYTTHAIERMHERRVNRPDIVYALINAATCSADDEDEDKWKVTGPDLDGDNLKIVVVIEGGVLVVTVF